MPYVGDHPQSSSKVTSSSEPGGINVASAAKAAVHAWSKELSRELGQYGSTVNSLLPGRIHSEPHSIPFRNVSPAIRLRLIAAADQLLLELSEKPPAAFLLDGLKRLAIKT